VKGAGPETGPPLFLDRIALLKSRGFTASRFGNIDLECHREWVERVCRTAGLKAVLPQVLQTGRLPSR